MILMYLVKVGMKPTPFFVQITSVDYPLRFSELKIEEQYNNLPFQIEVALFDQEGVCVQYLSQDSYSFCLVSDLQGMTDHLLSNHIASDNKSGSA